MKPIYVLVKNLFFATRIVKTAQAAGLPVRCFDEAVKLVGASKTDGPNLVIMDCHGLEKEAFQVLKAFREDPGLSRISKIGYLTHGARDLKMEMEQAGCEHVYTQSEFTRELENLLVKYNHGLPSRV